MKKVYLLLAVMVQVSIVFSQTHFVKGYIGNGTDQMNLNIFNADINGVKLQAGDEIAVFDGNLCCGVIALTHEIDTLPGPNKYFPTLLASAESFSGATSISNLNGYHEGNKIYFRFWDSSEGKEYHNVILTFFDQSTGQPTNAINFTRSATAFISASTASTTLTWVGGNNAGGPQNWSNVQNWNPKVIPEPLHSVVIPSVSAVRRPIVFAGTNAFAGSLSNSSILTISSDETGDGSLIVANGISGSGTAIGMRTMTPGAWHLVSTPVSGELISDFLTNNSPVPTKDTDKRGLMTYNETTDNWNNYFTNSSGGTFDRGVGYCVRIDDQGDPALNSIMYSGLLSNGDVSISVSKDKFGWNLVGNPFTSAMYVKQEVNGFLIVNSAMLDDSYEVIYIWDETSSSYTPITLNDGQRTLASGQGFFIKAASSGSVTFKQAMQVHQSDAFKSAVIPWPTIVLSAKAGNISSTTKINFNEEMNLGLDRGYDAGILRSGNGFDIYSRLVTDNGVDFMVQALPGKSTDRYLIPVGVDAAKGGEIVFSANSLNLPNGYQLVLEDKLTNSFTDLKDGEMYVANLASNSKGTGRFYLHVGSSLQTGIQEIQENKLVVYNIDNTVYIKGDVGNNAQFAVYSIDGRLINRFGATSQNLNQMSTAGYKPGIYFINVLDKIKYKPVKFVVGN